MPVAKFMDGTVVYKCLQRSVLRASLPGEAPFISITSPVTIVLLFAALRWSLFGIFGNQPIMSHLIVKKCLSRGPWPKLRIYLLIVELRWYHELIENEESFRMVVLSSILLILTSDAKSQLSAGFGRALHKVTTFLTWTIYKKSSNQADYTPIR